MAQFRPKFGQKLAFLGYKNRQKVAILGSKIGSRFWENLHRLQGSEKRPFADKSAELATLVIHIWSVCYPKKKNFVFNFICFEIMCITRNAIWRRQYPMLKFTKLTKFKATISKMAMFEFLHRFSTINFT